MDSHKLNAVVLILQARDRILMQDGLLDMGAQGPDDYERVAKHILIEIEQEERVKEFAI